MSFISRIYDSITQNSYIYNAVYITSKIENNVITTFNAAIFGKIVYGRSIFGYGVQYGSNLVNSQINDDVELSSGYSDNIQLISKLQEA
jgi:hypothetical protein